ncbi:hypothetical protein CANINC_001836 [Pichia inconspicua]|uniref:RING-type domain-containing protein n=1 Tax=Pichia inconspicua TaxID=52247 RepID=A0A4T0X3W3_9ASCO|nr:hypothetical protein CANINC_001836 [[Candida] inconspicua]
MSTYEQEHNIQSTSPTPPPRQTLQRVLDAFLTSTPLNDSVTPQMLSMLESLTSANTDTTKGVDQSFLDSLDRVSVKTLNSDDSCPICTNEYLSDKYPLVVELPCPGRHRFDLECIAPWLRANTTCPLCRADVTKKVEIMVEDDDEEEEDDDDQWGMYG